VHLLQLMVSRYQPDPQASAASLRRAQGKLRLPVGPRRSWIGQHPHGRAPCRGRLCEPDEKLLMSNAGVREFCGVDEARA